ncbi:MAG TPA: hypothetical protein VMT73_05975 [Anaerolineales bacterium]|nr:hypothetical protein [Anaerolineales bacterium]
MTDVMQWFRGLFHKEKAEISDELIRDVIRSLQMKHDDECDCNDVYKIVDQYAETQIKGEDAAKLMPLIKEHLDTCNDCSEQYQALLEILEKSETKDK